MSTFKGVYIDDDQRDFGYADLLSSEEVSFEKMLPSSFTSFANTIVSSSPDVVVMDYRLDDNQQGNSDNDYRAGSLAQQLREKLVENPENDFPIILVSSEDNIRRFFQPDRTAHDLFDEWYFKSAIASDAPRASNEIRSLVHGYKSISKEIANGNVLSLLRLNEDETFIFDNTSLDIELEGRVTHVLAKTILRNIVMRPGILLRPADVYAMLGIELTSYAPVVPEIWSVLETNKICYEGVFSDGWPRVWKHRLEFWLKDKFGKSVTGVSSEARVTTINNLFQSNYLPAPSRWTGRTNELPSFACASCQRPTEIRNSVAAYDPGLPAYIEKKRICFDCIEADKFERLELRISQEDRNLVDKIRRQELARE